MRTPPRSLALWLTAAIILASLAASELAAAARVARVIDGDTFRNVGSTVLVLTGWSVSDESNQSYLVPEFTLGAGQAFTLYTGSGKNSGVELYGGRQKTVWNRGGDTVIVRDSTGRFVISHIY